MSAALGQLQFTIATLIKGFAPGTALQMLHDSALDACIEYGKYDLEILTPAQRDLVLRDRNQWLDEVGAASEAPAAAWNAAHPNEPQVWPRMVMGDGPRPLRCQFYSSGLTEFPAERTRWFDEAGIDELGRVDPESLEHVRRVVVAGEAMIETLTAVRAPADWLIGESRVDRAAAAILNLTASVTGSHVAHEAAQRATRSAEAKEPGGGEYDCRDEAFGGLFACGLGERGPAIWGVAGAVGSLAVMGMLPVSLWVRLLGAVVGGAGAYAVMRRGAA